jgi:dihydroorotase
MAYDLLIEDATIVSSRGRLVADIGIEGGRIAYIGTRPMGRAKEKMSAIGKFVMPGIIDTHVHFRSPGHPHKETWASGSRAAVSSGVTTVLDMPNTDPPTIDLASLKAKRKLAAAQSRCNYGIWAGATSDNIDALNAMMDAGACGIKIFMAGSTGPLLVPPEALEKIYAHTRGLIGVHAEDEQILAAKREEFRNEASPLHHLVRPDFAAESAVRTIIDLVREHKRHTHICHLSTALEIHLVDPTRGVLPITIEACPHHLFLSTDTTASMGNRTKCNPPVRLELDRKAMWTALKRGRIDTIGSDHAPHTLEEKERPYWEAPSGIPGVETTFPLMLAAIHHGKIGLERMVELLSEAPAKIFGLENKGEIATGRDADLVLFSEGELHRFSEDQILSKCGWSPYVGRELGPKPDLVLVGGRKVASHGVILDDDARGKEVRIRPR